MQQRVRSSEDEDGSFNNEESQQGVDAGVKAGLMQVAIKVPQAATTYLLPERRLCPPHPAGPHCQQGTQLLLLPLLLAGKPSGRWPRCPCRCPCRCLRAPCKQHACRCEVCAAPTGQGP